MALRLAACITEVVRAAAVDFAEEGLMRDGIGDVIDGVKPEICRPREWWLEDWRTILILDGGEDKEQREEGVYVLAYMF